MASPLRAVEAKLQQLDTFPEGAMPASLGDALDPEGLGVVLDGKVVAELWFRRQLPLKEAAVAAKLGSSYSRLAEGVLVGVVRFPDRWLDYRGKPVPAGIYTLRYGIEPADGNHMGASEYRDFLLLVPISADGDPGGTYDTNKLIQLSKKASRTNHPAVLALVPVPKDAAAPSIVGNQPEQCVVAAQAGSLLVGLVIRGHAEGL